ncbi:hypothetical protein [Vibrio splendidus]|uniref:hypothetical protein n=1 Tax=Vibrio splendidus TaxID=29497 RepID=UPI000D3ABDB0|nr:hypothetical protein [Vibrio splendidus]PTP81271.1 hypothetical protein CWO00_01510 [Vibrio splendidus]
MTQSKSEINKKHYEQSKDALKEKARVRRVEAKKLKRFSELLQEFASQTQLAETRFIEQVVKQTKRSPIEVATIYKELRKGLKLTENQRLHINNNIPARKALLMRLEKTYQVSDLL